MHHELIGQHVKGNSLRLETGMDIPFKSSVHKKVYMNLDKADIEEKEESV